MEFLLSLIAYSLHAIWPIPILLILFLYICARFLTKHIGSAKSLTVAVVAIVLMVIVFFARNYIIVPIINYYGIPAEAKVLSSSGTIFYDASYQRQYRYKALFKRADGEVQEISYWTRPGNIYPFHASSRVAPISVGSDFKVKYLPLFPKSFIFVASSPRDSRACQNLAEKITELKIRLEFESDNVTLQQALDQLEVQQQDTCGA